MERKLTAYMKAIHDSLDPRVQSALKRIPAGPRRLLAMKYYLHRTPEEIDRKWAWSSEQARQFKRSAAYTTAREEIERVKQKFAELNPGYRLEVTVEIRTLGTQIGKWNRTGSIGQASSELMDSVRTLLSDSTAGFDGPPGDSSVARFIGYLREFEPERLPTVAVPGLSQHGQLRAFDFRIMQGRRLVAGTSSSTIETKWNEAGWTERLREAIYAASDKFEGPLAEPFEPWHYTYMQ
jgi:hypothetical protein